MLPSLETTTPVLLGAGAFAAFAAAGWGALFLRFRWNDPVGLTAACCWLALSVALLAGGLFDLPWLWLVFAAAFVGLLGWFFALTPRADRDWAPEVSRFPSFELAGERLIVHDVRDFRWRSDHDIDLRWESRIYDLTKIEGVDIFNSYWTGPAIAHTLVSFGFRDGQHLVFSIEIRKLQGEDFSSLKGFVRGYELAIVAADERDIVAVRTNVRGEDVRLFRLSSTPPQARAALLDILARAERLSRRPAFYNSLLRNCTTELFSVARRIAPDLRPDWRILLSGYLPGYLYDAGLLDTRLSLDMLRERGRVAEKARDAGDAADFSDRIRFGVPRPEPRPWPTKPRSSQSSNP